MQTLDLWQHSAEQSASGKADERNRKKEGVTLSVREPVTRKCDLHVGEQELTSAEQELPSEMLL